MALFRRDDNGALTELPSPYDCLTPSLHDAVRGCQHARGLDKDTYGPLLSPDGRSAYVYGDKTVAAFSVVGQNGS